MNKKITLAFFVCAAFLAPLSADAASLSRPPNNLGLVGYWSFNEGSGTIAGDFSGRGNAGTLTGGPTWVEGKFGKGLGFDGSDDYVNLSSRATTATDNFTLSAWVKFAALPQAAGGAILYNGDDSAGYGFGLGSGGSSNVLYGLFGSVVWISSGYTFTETNTWYHVVMLRDNGTTKFYVNGIQTSNTSVSTPNTPFNKASIGASISNDHSTLYQKLNGSVDEARIYNRALSPTEVGALYNSGGARVNSSQTAVTAGLVGRWTFDGAHTLSTIADTSGQANHGYFIGAATSSAKVMGKVGQALRFDGVNDQVTNTTFVWPTSNDAISVSLWIKSPGGGGRSAFTIGNAATPSRIQAHIPWSDNTLYWDYGECCGAGRITTSFAPYLNQWTHVVLTSNGVNAKAIHINGAVANSSSSGASAPTVELTGIIIGAYPGISAFHNGSIDDFRVYNRVLTDAEIKQIYDEGAGTKVNAASTLTQGGLGNGLVGHWTFDGADTGATIADKSGQANHGYFVGGATSTAKTIGKLGQALKFDGVDDHIPLSTDFGEPSRLAVSLWFKTSSATGQALFGQANVNPPTGASSFIPVLAITSSGLLRGELWTGGGGSITSAGSVADDQWHHAVIVGDTTIQHLYLDGAFIDSRSGTLNQSWWVTSQIGTAWDNTTRSLCSNWCYFKGSLDDVRVYNRALTADEVRQLYNLGR